MTGTSPHARFALGSIALCVVLSASLTFFFFALKGLLPTPYSTRIHLVDAPGFEPAMPPAMTGAESAEGTIRLAFVGDIMQHREQMQDRFSESYAKLAPLLADADLVVGNLEFPVDPTQPIGPPFGSVRFNGSPAHLEALANAGFDVLVTANNHSFDQGLDGAIRTVDQVEAAGMAAVGTGATWDRAGPLLVDARGTQVAIAAYTFRPNSYLDEDGEVAYWERAWPIHALNFEDWTDEYREEGLRRFREHADLARRRGAKILVAFVHWGEEWHFQPTEDQRLAGRDMIDAGFDLVVGSHSHVLNPAEIYEGRLIAYSLGNLISAFEPLEVRTGAVLEVHMDPAAETGSSTLLGFRYRPVITDRTHGSGAIYQVVPLLEPAEGDYALALRLARRILGEQSVVPLNEAEP
jgi:poly-gamma-glutamate synthesis protein (capsule biosynthesis protein)